MTKPSPPVLARVPLMLVGGAIAIAFTLVAIGPGAVGGANPPPQATLLAERTLVFSDLPDHSVGVFENGRQVDDFAGEQGFIRGVLRSMNRARKLRDLPHEAPLRLAAYADGRLILEDPATGVRLDLAAYGSTNEQVFAALLPVEHHLAPEYVE